MSEQMPSEKDACMTPSPQLPSVKEMPSAAYSDVNVPVAADGDLNLPPRANPSDFDRIKFIREEIRFEHSVLGNRISAYLAAQAFLMTAFAISSHHEHRRLLDMTLFSYFGLSILGIAISWFILVAVNETDKRLTTQRMLIYGHKSPLRNLIAQLRPEIDDDPHNKSLRYARWVPKVIVIMWVLIAVWGGFVLAGWKLGAN